jgi:hypothetical protein
MGFSADLPVVGTVQIPGKGDPGIPMVLLFFHFDKGF